jgi:hypothetical protein
MGFVPNVTINVIVKMKNFQKNAQGKLYGHVL